MHHFKALMTVLIGVCFPLLFAGCSQNNQSKPIEVGSEKLPVIPAEWIKFDFENIECSVFVPRNCYRATDSKETSDPNVLSDYVKAEHDDFALIIEFTRGLKLSEMGDENSILEQTLKKVVDTANKVQPTKLKSKNLITLDGRPGREVWLTESDGQATRRIWIVLVDQSLMQVNFVCGTADQAAIKKRNSFFDSIRLKKSVAKAMNN